MHVSFTQMAPYVASTNISENNVGLFGGGDVGTDFSCFTFTDLKNFTQENDINIDSQHDFQKQTNQKKGEHLVKLGLFGKTSFCRLVHFP